MGRFDIKGEGIRRTTKGSFKEGYVVISMVVEHFLVQSSCSFLHFSGSGLISLQPTANEWAEFLVSRVVLRVRTARLKLTSLSSRCATTPVALAVWG